METQVDQTQLQGREPQPWGNPRVLTNRWRTSLTGRDGGWGCALALTQGLAVELVRGGAEGPILREAGEPAPDPLAANPRLDQAGEKASLQPLPPSLV